MNASHIFRLKILKKSECKIIATILQPQKKGTHCLSGFPQFIVYSISMVTSISCVYTFFCSIHLVWILQLFHTFYCVQMGLVDEMLTSFIYFPSTTIATTYLLFAPDTTISTMDFKFSFILEESDQLALFLRTVAISLPFFKVSKDSANCLSEECRKTPC